jgi:uncharacterized membrane protein YphA (DoxX/SURF4 family)
MHLVIVNLRILIGFAFVPAGLKKVLRQPFTDPDNHGPFHDFLHAFQATGFFYQFVGIVQLTAAALLFSQRWARAGALLVLPVITAITVFCWSTGVYPTATVATLMLLGVAALLIWDRPAPFDLRPWQVCGAVVLLLYAIACVTTGEVYRPRPGGEKGAAFYLLAAMPLVPVATLLISARAGRARSRSARGPSGS